MALPTMVDGFLLAEQKLDEQGKVAGEARGRAIVVAGTRTAAKPGTEILFPEYAGLDVTIEGKPYLVVKEDEVFAFYEVAK